MSLCPNPTPRPPSPRTPPPFQIERERQIEILPPPSRSVPPPPYFDSPDDELKTVMAMASSTTASISAASLRALVGSSPAPLPKPFLVLLSPALPHRLGLGLCAARLRRSPPLTPSRTSRPNKVEV
ncbi:cp31AHv protein [Hordeum vulgare]|nr:cp31AHv protein [Hordeum vulgare]